MTELELLRRRVERERTARKEAERIAELKTRELYTANQQLEHMNEHLHELVEARTAELVKVRDQAVAANRAKSMFLANMSHELRTPLNAVIGYSEMILEEQTAADAALLADVRKIESAGKHLLTLINDILDLSKVEAGKTSLYYESADLAATVAEVVETVRPLAIKSGNAFEVRSTPDLGSIETDIVKLRQVLFNILSNAFKFTRGGKVELRVRRDDEHGRAWFEVHDSGLGIPVAQLDRLFVPFSQGDPSTTRRFGGTGLGLALSQKFCQLLGGEITVASEEGQGSVFRFWLPVAPSPVAERKSDPVLAPRGPVDGRPVVLVIDDDVSMHEMMTRHLANSELRVVCTTDPLEAVQLAREIQPAVITLDILMPRRDGWSVLSDLKQDADVCDIPVVLLSILDERGFGFALGAADYLVKPVPRGRLIETLRRHADPALDKRVLVVEDDVELRALMVRVLSSEGWTVIEAENGRVALDRVSEKLPAIIVLDLMMPEMDGFQFIAELHRIPSGSDVPVVVITAKDLTDEDVEFFRTKARVVLRKCIYDRETLLREVRKHLAPHRADVVLPDPGSAL